LTALALTELQSARSDGEITVARATKIEARLALRLLRLQRRSVAKG
jgi:hypothetical protein